MNIIGAEMVRLLLPTVTYLHPVNARLSGARVKNHSSPTHTEHCQGIGDLTLRTRILFLEKLLSKQTKI